MTNINNLKTQLQPFVEQIEELESKKDEIVEEIKEVFAEVKSTGLDVKTLKEMVRLRKLDAQERQEKEFLRDSYLRALGLISEEE